MSLATLQYPAPDHTGWEEWAWAHYQHHAGMIGLAMTKRNASLQQLQIYPMNPRDLSNWLQQHQQMHNALNTLLGTQGNDLSSVDWNNKNQRDAWVFLNFNEHRNAATILGGPA